MKQLFAAFLIILIAVQLAGCSYPQPTPFVFPTPMPTEELPATNTPPAPTEPATSMPPTMEPTSTAMPTVDTAFDFANATILIEEIDQAIHLVNGKYENKDLQIELTLSQFTLDADLNADGTADHAAILSLSTGGSGVFSILSAILDEGGASTPLLSYTIDDRIKVTGISAADGVIRVDYLGRTPEQPFSDEPTVPTTRYFTVSEGEIVEGTDSGADLVQSFAVTGTVTYLEKIALPDNAEVSIRLVDISKADAPAVLIDELTFPSDGDQVPFQFVLPYNPDEIDPEATIAVNASISSNGDLLFNSTRIYPVITRGNPSRVEIVLEKVN